MSDQEPIYGDPQLVARPNSNVTGVFGFVVSILGLLTCGLLSIISLILTIIGLQKEPRGTAVAGFILSLLGIVLLATSFGFILSGFLSFKNLNMPNFQNQFGQPQQAEDTAVVMQMATLRIGQAWKDNKLPDQSAGDALVSVKFDGWGNPLEYVTDGVTFSLISRGPDGTASPDDIRCGPFTTAEEASEAYGIDVDLPDSSDSNDEEANQDG